MVPLLLVPLLTGGTIEGRVTNAITSAGLQEVDVYLLVPGGTNRFPTTDHNGAFQIEDIPDGEYEIRFEKNGFYTTPSVPLKVRVSGDTRFSATMAPAATLTGRVLDPDGKPVAGVAVKLTGAGEAETDEDGAFKFDVVPPGSHQLSAIPKPQADAKDGERVVTTYYPSALQSGQSQSIQMESVDLVGYEIRLRKAAVWRVRGAVVDPANRPEAHAVVMLAKPTTDPAIVLRTPLSGIVFGPKGPLDPMRRFPSEAEPRHVDTDESGDFEFDEVPSGDWRLTVVTASKDSETNRPVNRGGVSELRLGREDVQGLKIRTGGAFPVDISADWGDSPPPSKFGLSAPLLAMDGQIASGTELLPGRYLVAPVPLFFPKAYLPPAG